MTAPRPRTARAPSLGSATLLLIPTELELRRFLDLGGLPPGLAQIELCGFGVVAAAARSAQLIARLRPGRVLLVGIAGAYDTVAHPVGEAFEFSEVALEGVGVGSGADLMPPPDLGFPQWPGSQSGPGSRRIDMRLSLASGEAPAQEGLAGGPVLLTTCAASADVQQAALRRERCPAAAAEDMEGFSVAMACDLADVPLRIVRGISNRVGDRDSSNWRIPGALAAARRLAIELLGSTDPWPESPA